MTSIALSNYAPAATTQAMTTAVVTDRRRRGELGDRIRAYYVTKAAMLGVIATMALAAGSLIGSL